ncbi:6-phosphogluconate dehydrogenase 2 [Lineolata rhizophorae]|uniref:6-phosphogluconate dehydrogenase 2 n=1 Tax=Lineolata rhizophorae TaxID=578093 RepID=A0A6A6NTR1_9PEZI|nr:6-phosphogluconate dehydrogenase 2 [Lineolata rhizophorae]
MSTNLANKFPHESPILLYNRTTARAESHAATLDGKAKVATSIPDAVVPSDVIFICVGDDEALAATIDEALAVPGGASGKLFVDCSTVHPDTTTRIAEQITGAGAEFVASPVFGAPAMADSGQLIMVLAGPAASVSKVVPYTVGVMARANIDFSDQPCAKSTLLKIVGNALVLNMVEMLSEAHVLAEKSGLGTAQLHQFVSAMLPGPYAGYSTRMTEGDYWRRKEPLFAVDLARKDASHMFHLAESSGCKLPNVETADRHLKMVKEHMGERGDISSIYGACRVDGGLKFENDGKE